MARCWCQCQCQQGPGSPLAVTSSSQAPPLPAPHRPPGAVVGEDSSSTHLFAGLRGVLPQGAACPAAGDDPQGLLGNRSGHEGTRTDKLGTPEGAFPCSLATENIAKTPARQDMHMSKSGELLSLPLLILDCLIRLRKASLFLIA